MPSAAALLEHAVELVTLDAPACARDIEDRLVATALAIELDGELAVLHHDNGLAVSGRRLTLPTMDVATTSSTVLDLLSGRDELLPAVRANRVRVRASPALAASCLDIISALIEGCARSPGGPALLNQLRTRVERNRYG